MANDYEEIRNHEVRELTRLLFLEHVKSRYRSHCTQNSESVT